MVLWSRVSNSDDQVFEMLSKSIEVRSKSNKVAREFLVSFFKQERGGVFWNKVKTELCRSYLILVVIILHFTSVVSLHSPKRQS